MSSSTFQFTPLPEAKPWLGRFNRIPGKEPAFMVSTDHMIKARWQDPDDDSVWLTSKCLDQGALAMGKAINKVKTSHAGTAGGAFHINEFGQVITMVAGSCERFWVGNIRGRPRFTNPLDPSTPLDLAATPGAAPGSLWRKPYIGMRFNLEPSGGVYFLQTDGDHSLKVRLQSQPAALIDSIRRVRGYTPVRFIVNLHGVVLTKVESAEAPKKWNSVFVGQIDKNHWYPREF